MLDIHLLDCLCQECRARRARLLARRQEIADEARSLSSALASDLIGGIHVATIPGYHVTERPRDHVATPSYRLSRPRRDHGTGAGSWRWSPRRAARGARRLVIDPRSLKCSHGLPWAVCKTHRDDAPAPRVMVKSVPRKTYLADRFVALECESIAPRGIVGPFQSDAVRGFVPWSVTCSEGAWLVDDALAHARAEQAELVDRWNRYERAAVLLASLLTLDTFYRPRRPRQVRSVRPVAPMPASTAPVLATRFSYRDAAAAALAGEGRWMLNSGAALVRAGDLIRFDVAGITYRERPADLAATGLRRWIERTTAAWHADRATILTPGHAPEALGEAMADVG